MAQHIMLSSSNFASEVLEAKQPVLVDFFATWCGPCRILGPVVEEIATERADTLKVCKVDIDDAPVIAQQYRIMSVPTLLLFKEGKVVQQLVGAQPKPMILAAIDKALA
ncbi:MAG: thioredoxin [Coriobacteriales bacterium]|nr:thioredoxin [Coriobacteriales bacterium]